MPGAEGSDIKNQEANQQMLVTRNQVNILRHSLCPERTSIEPRSKGSDSANLSHSVLYLRENIFFLEVGEILSSARNSTLAPRRHLAHDALRAPRRRVTVVDAGLYGWYQGAPRILGQTPVILKSHGGLDLTAVSSLFTSDYLHKLRAVMDHAIGRLLN
jgi:hypothetical protein